MIDTIVVNIEANFWECNPQFKYNSYFKDVYTADKSKSKEKSSKTIWATMLYCDPTRSQFYAMPEADRKKEILENYLNKIVPWNDVMEHVEAYKKFAISPLERQLIKLIEKLEARETFIDEQEYDTSNAKTLDDMIIKTPELWTTVELLQSKLKGQHEEGTPRGGGALTAVEKKEF